MKNSLAICGGGIRGIIPCSVLAALEKQTGKLTNQFFDYVSGTSTGALLAAGIAVGIPAQNLLEVYALQSDKIFTPSGVLGDAKQITKGYKFDPENLYKVLKIIFGSKASWVLNDCPIGVCINATAVNGHNWFFVKDKTTNAKTTGNIKLLDAAIASACAPTYFDCWPILIKGNRINFFDGWTGCLANPSYQACVEMFQYDSFRPEFTKLITLGTGYYSSGNTPPNGLIATIEWATDTLVDTSENWVDSAVQRQWPNLQQKFDWELPCAIDMADTDAIQELLSIGTQAATTIDWTKILCLN